MSFAELATVVQGLYDAGLSHRAIAARLTADGIPPPAGAAQWSWQAVDKILVAYAAQRQAAAPLRGVDGT